MTSKTKTPEEFTGSYCDKCGKYGSLRWGVCPRCLRTKAGRLLSLENKAKAEKAS